ncbi:MAG: YceI family protein [Balneolales bacterium]
MKYLLSLTLIFGAFTMHSAVGQSTSYTIADGSQIIVEGTSTVHDWTAEVKEIESNVEFDSGENEFSISDASIVFKVEDMESGKRRMNRLMHSALDEGDHPIITFRLNPNETSTNVSSEGIAVTAAGTVNIAGVEQDIMVDLEGQLLPNNEVRFSGSKELTMSDFEVDPPTAMLGTIRTADDIIVHFDLLYAPTDDNALSRFGM